MPILEFKRVCRFPNSSGWYRSTLRGSADSRTQDPSSHLALPLTSHRITGMIAYRILRISRSHAQTGKSPLSVSIAKTLFSVESVILT